MAGPSPLPPLPPHIAAENNLPRILAVTGIIHVLAIITIGLRLYVRIRLLRTPGWDDAAIVLATLGAMGGWICFNLQGKHGLGRHTRTISKPSLIEFDHIGFVQSVTSAIGALGMLKISIALFLLRLSKHRWYSRSLWALIVFVAVYTIGAWLTFFIRCKPMEGFWNKDPKATCYSIQTFITVALINTGFNIFTDVCFATLPIPIIWNLQMSRRTRINLIAILSLGYLCVVFGIIKAVYQIQSGKNKDKHFDVSLQFWGFLQLNFGIIAASIPTLKPLLRGGIGTSSGNRYNAYDGAGGSGAKMTIGGGRMTGPRRSILRSNDPKGFEMNKLSKSSASGRKDKDLYTIGMERTGSEDYILDSPNAASKGGIICTTEVSINNAGADGRV